MASCLPSLACCAGCCACSACAKCATSAFPKEQVAKVVHATLFIFISILSWVFSIWAQDLLDWVPTIHDAGECCSGAIAVYRLTWALFTFHIILSLSQIGVSEKSEWRAQLHLDWYSVKIVLFLLLAISAFYLPVSVFSMYSWIAIFGAGAFVLLQLLMLVDFAHSLNEGWVRQFEETGARKYVFFLSASTLICFAIAVVLSVLMYAYEMGPQNWKSPFFVSLNILFCFLITVISVHPVIQEADRSTPVGLFQAGFVSFYATYLVFAGLMDGTDSGALETTTMIIGSIFIIICVGYTAFRISGHEETYFGSEEEADDFSVNLMIEDDGGDSDSEETSKDVETKEAPKETGAITYNYAFFHLVFALGATYVCMLMTSWAAISGQDNETLHVDSGATSMWVKIVTSWIALAMYTWTVIAPVVLPDREW
mmetsp:Transcript_5912/g.7775  ORF Transcript_5912/g.7775 Transcript_5912/m.7775 type:complete len:426 (-) Transcript_5912:96-1373(-)|eukprot:CAMPEP_0201477880 /NCGR_PEP_ID=MMETSP0151_2-20130828/2827_1 /ASSEMBLY_ACC=CAM_ASM_000257 /TAXON_ID=200890 /ORGANISM="Paramoeba atlantica, Strain 621/1 / CCAP 1560/9" /LENGTH=425 /DNA_ID=CAMNT_0047858749 /DNA_START=129 /DNA_END=1406 /DNA_ORIENTATION=+